VIRRIGIACWIPKATNTHSVYVNTHCFSPPPPPRHRVTMVARHTPKYHFIHKLPVLIHGGTTESYMSPYLFIYFSICIVVNSEFVDIFVIRLLRYTETFTKNFLFFCLEQEKSAKRLTRDGERGVASYARHLFFI
jgi:hypothetical protein